MSDRAWRLAVRWSLLTAVTAVVVADSCTHPSSRTLDVGPSAVASVDVNPPAASLRVGEAIALRATVRDANGRPLLLVPVSWSGSDSAAEVNPTGRVIGRAPGEATIHATSQGQSGTSAIRVIDLPRSRPQVLVGAGDIADGSANAAATAALLDSIPGVVFTAGDNAYPDGSVTDFATRYDPTWGRHKARTRPCPGNHDYHQTGAAPYYAYFGANAGPAGRGYYSFDLGDWHVISLNSNIDMSAGSAEEQWLRADLAASRSQCTIAFWHHPRFSSGTHGSSTASKALWQALYDYGAEIVVVGHDHNYQRFAPQTADGVLDLARGIREFVAGTGGAGLYNFTTPIANTEAWNTTAHGVLKLTLGTGTYAWEFIPVAGQSYRDSGSGVCHR